MKIADSQLFFNTSRNVEEKRVSQKQINIWTGPEAVSVSTSKRVPLKTDSIENLFINNARITPVGSDESITLKPELMTMKRMLETLTGKKLKLTDIDNFKAKTPPLPSGIFQQAPSTETSNSQQAGWGIRYSEFQSYYEAEQTTVDTTGRVKTESGETIDFSLHLKMQREFYTEKRFEFSAGKALTDPLVINFDGNPTSLTDVKFKFDINSDGKKDDIPWLAPGSGFLVFDKNKDGLINNGSEMFGPDSGNGFEELAAFDTDKNGWIDENDSAFDELSILSGEGWDSAFLTDLKQAGIGAISLSNGESEFTVKDQANNTLGKIRRTGVYITEDGKAGSVQQIDFSL